MATKFEYRLRVPQCFTGPLKEKLGEFPGCARRRELYLYVLHIVAAKLRQEYRDARSAGKRVSIGSWHCHLQATFLKAAMGNSYTGIIEDLVNWGFIGRSFSYQPSSGDTHGRSKAFWFIGEYAKYWKDYCFSRERRMQESEFQVKKYGRTTPYAVKGRPFLKRLAACAADAKEKQMLDPRVARCHAGLSHFNLDRKRAVKVLDSMVEEGAMTPAKRKRELAKVDRFNSVNDNPTALFVKRDRFGRVHTNVTQLKKEIRSECLMCDGKPTAGVDIKSSQGAFLGAIFRSLADPGGLLDITASPTMNELRKQAAPSDTGKYLEECGRYETLLREGRLYEFFASEMSGDFDLDRDVCRDEAKHAFFVMLFGPVFVDGNGETDEIRSAVRRVWSEHFPALLLSIERMKAGNYAALAREMQRVESTFVFDRAVPRIEAEVGCPYCTVHDEIIVPEEYIGRVREIVEDELGKVGVPTMTAEEFGMAWKTSEELEFERAVELEMAGVYCAAVAESA